MAKLRLVGAVGIKVRPDASDFREEVNEQLKNLPKDAKIKIDVTADIDPAKKAIDKAIREEEKRTLNIKVGVQYDTLQAARRQVEGALKNLGTEGIKVKLKEGDLNAALDKLKGLQDRAKVTMQINSDEAGYKAALAKIRAIQREKAEIPITFETDDKSLAEEAAKYEKLLAKLTKPVAIPPKVVTITHRNDHDSLTRAIAAIDEQLAKLKEVELTPQLNARALNAARTQLVDALAKKPVVMKISDDKKGYEKVLARIQELQAQAAEIDFKFKTDPASLDRAAKAVAKKIADLTPPLVLKYNYETNSIKDALAVVNKELEQYKRFDFELHANMNEKDLLAAKKKLEKSLAKSDFTVAVDSSNVDALKAERKKIEDMLTGMAEKDLILKVKNNATSLEEAKKQLDDLIKEREAPVKAKALTFEAMAQLAYASRARDVPFYVRINQRSLAIAEGVLQSLAGLNTLRESGKLLENIITKFDTFSLKTAGVATVLGSVTDAIVFMGTALFPIGEGVANLVGLLAFAPAAMSALTATALINIMAFDNFKAAIDGSAEALAKLPPQAAATARSLQGAWTKIQEPVQDSFWRGMGDSMQTAMAAMLPLISKGLAESAEHVGRFGAGVFRAFEKITFAGGPLEQMLSNLSGFFDNAAGAAEPLFNAINTLGLRGSEFLPRFGTYLTDMATRFDNWITKADEAGKIVVWMEQGVQSLKDMWTLGGGVVKMFQGITMAAKDAGSGGLGAVADEFNRIGEMMKGEPFQSRLSTIFDGARDGASHFNDGLQVLGQTIGRASLFTANLLSQLGKLGGDALTTLSGTLRNLNFQSGILDGLQGMNTLINTLRPGFVDLGNIIGNLSTIAGGAFSSIGPVINNIISLLDVVVGTLGGELSALIPNLMGMVGGLISSLSGPITILSEGLAGVLSFVNSLPGPLAGVAASLVAFLLLAGKIGPMFATPKSGGLIEKVKYDFDQATTSAGKFNTVAKGLGAGALAAVGGPWGIAIGVLTTGFALAGQKAAEAKAELDSYSAAIDQNTGAINANAGAMVAKKIVDATGSAGIKTASETFKTLGMSIEEVANITAQGGPAYDAMIGKLKEGNSAAAQMASGVDEMGLPIQGNAEAWNKWTKQVGIGADALDGVELDNAIKLLESQRGAIDTNRNSWLLMNDAVDKGDQKLADFNNAMRSYNDTTATADSRTRALKAALDILNGKQPSLEEAQLRVNDAMRAAAGEAQMVNGQMTQVGGVFRDAQGQLLNFNGVIDATTGKINTQSTAGANLYRNLKDTTDGVLGTATAMKDAQAPIGEIETYLKNARDQYIKMGTDAGLSAEVVGAAYDHMIGANPKDLLTTITAVGVEEAKTRVQSYKGTLDEVNAYKAVAHIMGDDAILGEKLANSYTNLDQFNNTIATATANLNPEQADTVRQRILNDLINLAKTDPTVAAKMDPRILDEEVDRINRRLSELARQKPTPEVKAETADAQAQLLTVQGLISGIKSKDVKINVVTDYRETGAVRGKQAASPIDGNYLNGGIDSGFGVQMFANGGYVASQISRALSKFTVKAFASGGFENHVAQIARPSSTVRVWAEPETGGEAYIPLAAAKRQRSTAILSEVASQFGYKLAPVQAFAEGGVVNGGNSRNAGLQVHIDTFNQNANDTIEDVGRGIMRQARSAGLTGIMDGI